MAWLAGHIEALVLKVSYAWGEGEEMTEGKHEIREVSRVSAMLFDPDVARVMEGVLKQLPLTGLQ